MKIIGMTLRGVALLLFVSGCASMPAPSDRSAERAPVAPPQPVQLSDLPNYGVDKSVHADKSAGCFLLPPLGGQQDAQSCRFNKFLSEGLSARGYSIVKEDDTAEARRLVRKQLMVIDYSLRSRALPVREKMAFDLHVILRVEDRPEDPGLNRNARYFSVMARTIPDESALSMDSLFTQAVDHFFCLEPFCDALSVEAPSKPAL